LTYLNTDSLDVLVGLLLGDAYLKFGHRNVNVRIGFKQSIINFPFMWAVFNDLAHYCSSLPLPRYEVTSFKGKKYGVLILETRTYVVFKEIYGLFILMVLK